MEFLEPYFDYVFHAGFIALWLIICLALAKISGWSQLAKIYPCKEKFSGSKSYFSTICINGANYINVVTIGVNQTHFYLKLMFIFSFGSKPLLIPYTAIKGKISKWGPSNSVDLNINNIILNLSIKQADRMVKASKGTWHYQ